MIYHGGETAGYNSKMAVETTNDVTLVLWTNLTLDVKTEQQTANTLMLKVLDQIMVESPLASAPCPTPNIAGLPAFDYPATMQCGYLTVPENSGRAGRPSDQDLRGARTSSVADPGIGSAGGVVGRTRWGRVVLLRLHASGRA